MKKSKVRCWRLKNWRGTSKPDEIYISYPEGNSGYDLLSCLHCGHVYAASVVKQVYIGPDLKQKIVGLCCVKCSAKLSQTIEPYPEKYLSNGKVVSFMRPIEIPSDETSMVVEFDEIYD